MNTLRCLASVLSCLPAHAAAHAQHCASIHESYLSGISVERRKEGIRFRLEYRKSGGADRKVYQAYVVAYLERDSAQVPAPAARDVIDPEVALVLHTQLIRRNEKGVFKLEFVVHDDDLAKRMIAHRKLTEKDRTVHGGFGVYNDRIRLSVFVPFLDDKKYSVIAGLPEDRHECNYRHDRALLFQALPYRLSMWLGRRMEPGKHVILINGDRPERRGKSRKPR